MTSIAHTPHRFRPLDVTGMDEPLPQLAWFAAVAAVAFAVPYVLTSALSLNHDWYYLCYFIVALGVLALYVAVNKTDVVGLLSHTWRLSLVIGLFVAAFLVWNIVAREDATPRPHGAYFAFEFIWRGLAYGLVDALLLSAFPAMVAFALMHRDIAGLGRHVKFAALAAAMTIVITATYHLGYQQYRDDGVAAPETGNIMISIPAIVTGNPLGSLIAHTSQHGAAVTHSYETETFLPPTTSAK